MRRADPMRRIVPLIVAFAAAAGSCTEIGTNPTTITALEFDTLPYPAVVTGDSLRDSLGKAAPLHANAFNALGAAIPNAPITFLALDSGLTIGATGFVTAQARNATVRLIASAPGLQSQPLRLVVARRPDSVFATGTVPDTIYYVLPDNAGANVSKGISLKVATFDSANSINYTQGWLVSYQLQFHGQTLAITDTTIASLWGASGTRAQLVDTTDNTGTVAPRVRLRPNLLPSATESVTVVATVRYRGVPIRGSPVSTVIQIRPHTTSR